MAILWLGFMGLFLVALTFPIAQRFAYTHSGLTRQIVEAALALLMVVALFTGLFALIGYLTFGLAGAVTMGLAGMTASFIVVAIAGTSTAIRDPNAP